MERHSNTARTASVRQRHVGKGERQGVSLTLGLPVEVEGAAVLDAGAVGGVDQSFQQLSAWT